MTTLLTIVGGVALGLFVPGNRSVAVNGGPPHLPLRRGGSWALRVFRGGSLALSVCILAHSAQAGVVTYAYNKTFVFPENVQTPLGTQYAVRANVSGFDRATVSFKDGTLCQEFDNFSETRGVNNLLMPDESLSGGAAVACTLANFAASAAGASYSFVPQNIVSGSLPVAGIASAFAGGGILESRAHAFSLSRMLVRPFQIDLRGNVVRIGHDFVLDAHPDNAHTRAIDDWFNFVRVVDPVQLQLFDDDTGEILLEETLFEMEAALTGGDSESSSMRWDSNAGLFTLDAAAAESAAFTISLGGPFTEQEGMLELVISGGVVTKAINSGIFNGLLPSIGTLADFSIPLGDVLINYDLGDLGRFGDRNLGLTLGNDLNGEAIAFEAVAEPGSLLLIFAGLAGLGAVGLRRQGQTRRSRSGSH